MAPVVTQQDDGGEKRIAKTSELTSQVLSKMTFSGDLLNFNPAETKTEVIVEVCLKLGKSFKGFFKVHGQWLLELKKRQGAVNGSKGKPFMVMGKEIYFHELIEDHFGVTTRWMQQLEKTLTGRKELTGDVWQDPNVKEGDHVTFKQNGKTVEGVIEKMHATAAKVDVQPLTTRDVSLGTHHPVVTMPIDSVSKVKAASVKKINKGDLILCTDVEGGGEYQYEGEGKFKRTKTLSLNKQKEARDAETASLRAEADRKKKEKAEAEEKRLAEEKKNLALKAIEDNEKMLADQKKMVKSGTIPAGLIGKKKLGKKNATLHEAHTGQKEKSWTVRRQLDAKDNEDRFEVLDRDGESIMKGTQKDCEARQKELTAMYAQRSEGAAA